MTKRGDGNQVGSRKAQHRQYGQLAFLAILLVAAVVRFALLGSIPSALFRDEAEKALNAWSLLQTGSDLDGHRWPVFIRAFGVTTSAIYQYAAIPPLWLLGPSDLAARVPAAVFGFLAVLVLPMALRGAVPRRTAIACAFALALSPWHIPMSRWAQQGIFLPVFLLLLFAGWNTLGRARPWRFALGMGAGALAAYTYDPARLLVPMFIMVATGLRWQDLRKRPGTAAMGFAAFGILAVPVVWLLVTQTGAAQARFRAIGILSLPWKDAVITGIHNYVLHFSPGFLLTHGDAEARHGAGGILGPILGLGLWIGLATSLRRPLRQRRALLIAMVLLGPIPAALTREGIPHALRTIGTAPFFVTMAVLGYRDVWIIANRHWPGLRKLSPRTCRVLAAGLLLLNSGPFLARYFGAYARDSAFSWQYGLREGLGSVWELRKRGVRIVGCSVVGGGVLARWYALSLPLPEGGLAVPAEILAEAPFGFSPIQLEGTAGSLPTCYLAIPGLESIPGGLRLPVWYQGYGSSDGKNETLLEIHLNKAAARILRQDRPGQSP